MSIGARRSIGLRVSRASGLWSGLWRQAQHIADDGRVELRGDALRIRPSSACKRRRDRRSVRARATGQERAGVLLTYFVTPPELRGRVIAAQLGHADGGVTALRWYVRPKLRCTRR
jgi:hypothetical protein